MNFKLVQCCYLISLIMFLNYSYIDARKVFIARNSVLT